MSAIVASTVRIQSMADDSIRLTIDIDPAYADLACELFRKRGVPCAIVRLTNESAVAEMQSDIIKTELKEDKKKGGPLARLAGQLCNNPEFIAFANVSTSEEAAESIRIHCNIDSRAQLDHDAEAAKTFHELFRIPFSERTSA
jgi:hypothetical protein